MEENYNTGLKQQIKTFLEKICYYYRVIKKGKVYKHVPTI